MAGSANLVDPRGLRFAATITAIVLAVVLLTSNAIVLAVQTAVFAIGAFGGMRRAPYGQLFRYTLAKRLGPPAEREPEAPPRFAQAVGVVFAAIGVIGFAVGLSWLGLVATALAFIAAFLNAAFGYCLGCEIYLLSRRLLTTRKGVPA
jgi:Ca2+/Na+ antiporter